MKDRSWLSFLLTLLVTVPSGYFVQNRMKRGVFAWVLMILAYIAVAYSIAVFQIPRIVFIALLCFLVSFRLFLALDASFVLKKSDLSPRRNMSIYMLLFSIFIALDFGAVAFCRGNILGAFWVPTNSMFPTLQQEERFTASKLFSRNFNGYRGKLAIVQFPGNQTLNVKRIVAIQGDHLRIAGSQLYVNSKEVNEPYAFYDEEALTLPPKFDNLEIPDGHIFVMGDNRNSSSDSRNYGPIRRESIKGIPTNIFWSRHFSLERTGGGPPVYRPEGIAWERLGKTIRE